MIAIVDYGMGNLKSVEKGFKKVGIDAIVTSSPGVVDNAEAIVLPGVGAFKDCIRNLTDLSLTESVVSSINKGSHFSGYVSASGPVQRIRGIRDLQGTGHLQGQGRSGSRKV